MPDGSVKSKNKSLETNLKFRYMPGFGNDFETEALPGALPQGMNSPQKCAYGLYAEQLSGTPFTHLVLEMKELGVTGYIHR